MCAHVHVLGRDEGFGGGSTSRLCIPVLIKMAALRLSVRARLVFNADLSPPLQPVGSLIDIPWQLDLAVGCADPAKMLTEPKLYKSFTSFFLLFGSIKKF